MSASICYDGCEALIEWRCDALGEDGQVVRSLFACGDFEDLGQQIANLIYSSGQPVVSVNVMQWAVSR